MTKQMKQLTIDFELIEMLEKEENMSGLINNLLHNHFNETHDFEKLRIMNELKLLRTQEREFNIEKDRVEEKVKAFLTKDKEVQDERKAEGSHKETEERGDSPDEYPDSEILGSGDIKTE